MEVHYINELISINDNNKIDGRELYDFLQIGTEYVKWFERMCEYGFEEGKDYSSFLTNRSDGKAGKPKIDHEMTIGMAKEISMIQRNERGKQARLYFIECERRLQEQQQKQQKQLTAADMFLQNAKLMKEHELQLAKLTEETQLIKDTQKKQQSTLETLNGVCTDGTKRQKLNTLIRNFVNTHGLQYAEGWKKFLQAFNTAYHTNLNLQITNYVKANNLRKKVSKPEFLELTNQLDDALRVAEKM